MQKSRQNQGKYPRTSQQTKLKSATGK